VRYYPGLTTLPDLPFSVGELIGALLLVNKWMVVFNMIPAYPMDGGRLFRAVLAKWLPYTRATAIAAKVGQVFSVGFVVIGLLTDWFFLAVIGVLIFLAAGAEEKTVRLRDALQKVRVGNVMSPVFITVGPDDAAGGCAPWIFKRGQDDFPVVADGRLVGMLTQRAVLEAARRNGPVRAAELMTTVSFCARPDEPVAEVHDSMQASGQRTVPVMDDDRLVGLLTLDNINRYYMTRSAGAAKDEIHDLRAKASGRKDRRRGSPEIPFRLGREGWIRSKRKTSASNRTAGRLLRDIPPCEPASGYV
jgi:CBS domain-containing protein